MFPVRIRFTCKCFHRPPLAVATFRGVELLADCSETGMSGGLDLSNDPAGRWPHTAPPAPHWRYASASRRAAASGVPNRRKTCQSLSDKRQGRNSQDAKSQPRNYERIICGQFEHCGLLQAGLQKLTPTWRCGTQAEILLRQPSRIPKCEPASSIAIMAAW